MEAPALHPEEGLRLEALAACQILDTPRELSFDLLASVAAEVANTEIALVSLIDRDRQWFKARIGLNVAQTERSISFCGHAILQSEPLIVEDTQRDPRFHDNPLVLHGPHVRFYAGFPVKARNGLPLGTLCVIHSSPKRLSQRQKLVLSRLAQQVGLAIELRKRVLDTERELQQERDDKRARALLCLALIHDMKSPMLLVGLAAEALSAPLLDRDQVAQLVGEILSASDTLARMVLDVLDMIYEGTPALEPRFEPCNLCALVLRVHDSFRKLFASRGIALSLSIPSEPVWLEADPELLRRVLHNLLDNAYKYGGDHGRIEIGVATEGERIKLWIEDEGPGIPEGLRAQVFDLYARLDDEAREKGRSGHGIGLAFCKLAVSAHGGEIGVRDGKDGHGCRFWIELPTRLGPYQVARGAKRHGSARAPLPRS